MRDEQCLSSSTTRIKARCPPPLDPSGVPTPPPAPSNPQYADDSAATVPQTGVTFTPMPDKSRSRIKRIVVGAVALVAVVIVGTIALTVANWTRTPEAKVRQYLDLLADGKASAATAMKATEDGSGVYTGEATFTIQGMESWEKQRDVTSRITATVKTDKDGIPELGALGKPQFEVRFGY